MFKLWQCPARSLKNFLIAEYCGYKSNAARVPKQRPSHTFFNIKSKESHSFQGTSPVIFSFKRVRWISFVNKCYWDITYKTIMIAAAKNAHISVVEYMFYHVDISYNYFYNCSISNGIRRQFDPRIVFLQQLQVKKKTKHLSL